VVVDDVVLVLLVPVVPVFDVSVGMVLPVSVDIVPAVSVDIVSTATVSVVDIVSLDDTVVAVSVPASMFVSSFLQATKATSVSTARSARTFLIIEILS
jgi:hypothetical protein